MRTNCVKNVLAVGIILLFIGVAISPVITAVDNDIDDMNDESKGNCEIGTSDDYEEIITRISGFAKLKWIKIKVAFKWKNYGEAEIIIGNYTGVNLLGIRLTNEGKKIFFERDAKYIYAPRFIGETMASIIYEPYIIGWAFGNIDWH